MEKRLKQLSLLHYCVAIGRYWQQLSGSKVAIFSSPLWHTRNAERDVGKVPVSKGFVIINNKVLSILDKKEMENFI
jgi:hypothetical protein